MATVADVLRKVKEKYPGFYPTTPDPNATPETDALALEMVNAVHADIVLEAGLYPFEPIDVSLTAGVREYALDSDVYQIGSATYYNGASSYTPMRPTSVDELDYRYVGWRDFTSGTPFQYYEDGGFLGFYETPSQSTIAGYPKVVLQVKKRHAFTAFTDPLPPQATNMDAWVYGVCFRWADDHNPEDVEKYAALSASALRALKTFTQTKLMRNKPKVRPAFARPYNR